MGHRAILIVLSDTTNSLYAAIEAQMVVRLLNLVAATELTHIEQRFACTSPTFTPLKEVNKQDFQTVMSLVDNKKFCVPDKYIM